MNTEPAPAPILADQSVGCYVTVPPADSSDRQTPFSLLGVLLSFTVSTMMNYFPRVLSLATITLHSHSLLSNYTEAPVVGWHNPVLLAALL